MNNPSLEQRFWEKVQIRGIDECWEWTAALNRGYGWFNIHRKARHSNRVAAFLCGLIDSMDSKLHVLHKCDNPKCCNPNHFFLGTNRDNIADRVAKGRTGFRRMIGETNGMAKLSNEDIKNIRKMYNEGNASQSQIARLFNVRQPHISKVVNNIRCGGVL